jgi:DNA-binding NarL/FixJ family response regulator
MTNEQRRAHLRMLESLPKTAHVMNPPIEGRRRVGWEFRPQVEQDTRKEIFKLHSRGMQGKDIASQLGISASTVSRYLNWTKEGAEA